MGSNVQKTARSRGTQDCLGSKRNCNYLGFSTDSGIITRRYKRILPVEIYGGRSQKNTNDSCQLQHTAENFKKDTNAIFKFQHTTGRNIKNTMVCIFWWRNRAILQRKCGHLYFLIQKTGYSATINLCLYFFSEKVLYVATSGAHLYFFLQN